MLKSEIRKQRELQILSKLDKLGIGTIEHLRKLNVSGLGDCGKRNALRVLGEMEKDGLVVSKHVGVKLFSCREGSRFGFWEHTLLRNDFLIWKGWFNSCSVERPITLDGKEIIRPDAVLRLNGEIFAIEVDRMQTKRANIQKMEIYRNNGIKFGVVGYRDRLKEWSGCVTWAVEDFR